VIPSEVTTALKTLSGAFGSESASLPAAPQAGHGQLSGTVGAALTADGAGPSSPATNGDLAKAERVVAEEAAHTREELAQVEQEVAAVQRQVAETEGTSPGL
jgi:hypothetical protein